MPRNVRNIVRHVRNVRNVPGPLGTLFGYNTGSIAAKSPKDTSTVREHGSSCLVPEQCSCSERSERAERSERSEHVWPQIVRNIWPTLAKHQSRIGQNQPKTPKVNMLRSGDVSFDFGFEWCLGSATGYVAKINPKSLQKLSKSAQNTKSQHVEIWGCQF